MNDVPLENWRRLRGAGIGDGVLEVPSFPTEVDSGYGRIRYALGPAQEMRLLVPVGPGALLPKIGPTGKLALAMSKFSLDGRGTQYLDLMCADRALDTVFAELATAVINRVAGGSVPGEAVELTVSEFRDLLGQGGTHAAEDSAIYGLVGELIVLRGLSRVDRSAVSAWIGSFEERHDFRKGIHAIEVKTSSRIDSRLVSISSIEQLTEPSGGTLTLVHVALERADGGAVSVGGLYEEICALGVDRARFNKALGEVPCIDPGGPDWNRLSFNLEKVTGYQVTVGFPRVSSEMFSGGSVPVGIKKLVYTVDLSTADQFRLNPSGLDNAYRRFLS